MTAPHNHPDAPTIPEHRMTQISIDAAAFGNRKSEVARLLIAAYRAGEADAYRHAATYHPDNDDPAAEETQDA